MPGGQCEPQIWAGWKKDLPGGVMRNRRTQRSAMNRRRNAFGLGIKSSTEPDVERQSE